MSTIQPNYLFLNNPAAADVALANRILTLGQNANSIAMNVQKVDSVRKVESEAAVAGVQTVTVTTPGSAIGTDYSFQIIQQIGSEYRPVFVSYQSVTGDDATTVAAALTSVVNAQIISGNLILASATSALGVITLTATTSNPVFVTQVLDAGAGTVVAVTTPGNEAFGQGTDLIAEGVIGISEQPVAGTSYDALFIPYGAPVEEGNTIKRDQAAYLVVYYNEAGASVAAFVAALNAAIAASPSLSNELVVISDVIV